MTAYNFGDVVLIGFPHSDLQGVSKRPALVLYDSGDQDILEKGNMALKSVESQNVEFKSNWRDEYLKRDGLIIIKSKNNIPFRLTIERCYNTL